MTARRPVASTNPRTELAASLFTTSAAGMCARVTEITSSSRRGGTTRFSRRLESRSITSANAAMEHKSKGQMGHPAACMIENNQGLSTSSGAFRKARLWPEGCSAAWLGRAVCRGPFASTRRLQCDALGQSTAAVDNIVCNRPRRDAKPRRFKGWNRLLKLEAREKL